MRRHPISILYLLALAASITSCRHQQVPDNLIDTATMTAILTEYYLIDGYDYAIASRYPDSLGYQSKVAKDSMLKRFSITQTDFDSSLYYYTQHPKVFEEIMGRTIKALDRRSTPLALDNQE